MDTVSHTGECIPSGIHISLGCIQILKNTNYVIQQYHRNIFQRTHHKDTM